MKALKFTVTVEGLPDHAKDYRVQGDICFFSTHILRQKSKDGAVNVIVSGAELVPFVRVGEEGG